MKKILLYSLLIVLFSLPAAAHAQSDPDPDGTDPDNNAYGANGPSSPTGDPGQNAPFDGGVSILLAAGVGYGVKKWREGRKGNKENASGEK